MKKLFIILIVLFSFSCSNNSEKLSKNSDSLQTGNADYLIQSVLWYKSSGEMRALYLQGYNLAKIMLDKHLQESKSNRKKAVVVDVDETVLSNVPFEVEAIKTGVAFSKESWKKWSDQANAKALPGAVAFLNYAKSKNVEVFYITNRKAEENQTTIKNLANEGFPYADTLHFVPKANTSSKKERREMVLKNYDILLLVGDNLGDFSEVFEDRSQNNGFDAVDQNSQEFGNRFIVLPNPMYGDWEKAVYTQKTKNQDSLKMMRNSKLGE